MPPPENDLQAATATELRRRRAQRRRADPRVLCRDPQRTIFEDDSVRANTKGEYSKYLAELQAWSQAAGLPELCEEVMDEALARWMEEDFLCGNQSARGSMMIVAVKFHFPRFNRDGDLRLPRAALAMKGWKVKRGCLCRGRRWPSWRAAFPTKATIGCPSRWR